MGSTFFRFVTIYAFDSLPLYLAKTPTQQSHSHSLCVKLAVKSTVVSAVNGYDYRNICTAYHGMQT